MLAPRGSRRAGSAGRGGPWERIAGAAHKGFAARTALGLAGLGARQTRPERSRQARRGLRAISGQSHAKRRVVRCALFCRVRAALLFGTRVLVSKRCFAPPRTGCRFGRIVRVRADFAELAGSAVRVILQDWQVCACSAGTAAATPQRPSTPCSRQAGRRPPPALRSTSIRAECRPSSLPDSTRNQLPQVQKLPHIARHGPGTVPGT